MVCILAKLIHTLPNHSFTVADAGMDPHISPSSKSSDAHTLTRPRAMPYLHAMPHLYTKLARLSIHCTVVAMRLVHLVFQIQWVVSMPLLSQRGGEVVVSGY